MVVTVATRNDGYVWLKCKNKRYIEAWGNENRTTKADLFSCMSALTSWANNELNEEMLFEVE